MSDYASINPITGPIVPRKQEAKRHYGSHPYFTRRAWNVVREYIRTFAPNKGDVVCDPFGGSGVTAIEALILRRRAIHVDINPFANFICRQIAVSPVSLDAVSNAFHRVAVVCKSELERLRCVSDSDMEKEAIPYWYPQGISLPRNADVACVDDLFTRRQLISLSILHHRIQREEDEIARLLLLFTFSATLAKVNRTFVSAHNRADTRGGATIFSVYRYNVPKQPVELDVWEQFAMRFSNLLKAKRETNQLIGDYYQEDGNFQVYQRSATQLTEFIAPESVDYIYTDPPYGAHIAYLGLSTMWNAWLGFPISEQAYSQEVIEGGDLNKSKSEYERLLRDSIREMSRVLKPNRWLSLVFSHKETGYWNTIVEAAQDAGLEYRNTVVQSEGVVWSMHKKKNPLTVLSGELVLNFYKTNSPKRIQVRVANYGTLERLVTKTARNVVLEHNGATTEQIYYALIPTLLEAGLLAEARKQCGDITPFLNQSCMFDEAHSVWKIKSTLQDNAWLDGQISTFLTNLLEMSASTGITKEQILKDIRERFGSFVCENEALVELLDQIAYSPDGVCWRAKVVAGQTSLAL